MNISKLYIFFIHKVTITLFILTQVFSCVSTNKKVTNITPMQLIYKATDGTPTKGMKAEKKSNALKAQMLNLSPSQKKTFRELSKFKTFFVMPLLEYLKSTGKLDYESLNDEEKELFMKFSYPDIETQNKILFELRNFLEENGYLFVSIHNNPDVIFCMFGTISKYSAHVPPSLYSFYRWVPGKTITENSRSSGSLDFSAIGDENLYGWGDWNSTTRSTTHLPGHLKKETHVRPGHSIEVYYPSVIIFGNKIDKNLPIFLANAIGISKNPDFSVNAQFVIRSLLEDLERGPYNQDKNIVDRRIGIKISILTNNGEDYFPTVMNIKKGSPAHQAGIKLYDMIIEVNDKEFSNEPYSQVMKYISSFSDSILDISIWRVDKQINLKVKPSENW